MGNEEHRSVASLYVYHHRNCNSASVAAATIDLKEPCQKSVSSQSQVYACKCMRMRRRLSLILIFILSALMAIFACPGCGRDFRSNASLSAHKRSCKDKITAASKVVLRNRLDKRHAAAEQQESENFAEKRPPAVTEREPSVRVSCISLK